MHGHISGKRPTDTFLLFLVSTSNIFIVFFRELAQTAQTSIGTYIEESPSSALAQLVDRESQRKKLRMAAEDILQTFLPAEAVDCAPVRTFLTEILASAVLEKTVEKCSSADFINGWIIYLLEAETQPEILQKIDISAVEGSDEGAAAAEQRAKQKRLSRAEEEMEKAMKEAQELSKMIAEDEAKAVRGSTEIGVSPTSSTNGVLKDGITESPVRTSLDDKDFSSPSAPPEASEEPSKEEEKPPTPPPRPGAFTSFDQLVVPATEPQEIFFRAHVELSDLTPVANGSDKRLRSKPTSSEYFLQIEPASNSIPGWIITRKYHYFEALHEVLSRISKISGVVGFSDLPTWRGQTKESLRADLEKYLNSALKIHGLAECEGMKRFLEKHNAIAESGNNDQGGFARLGKAWPNPQALAKVGGGMLDALAKAPQGAAEGGKALFGGVFRGGVGIKRSSTSSTSLSPPSGYGDNSPQSGTSRSSIESLKLAQPTTRERSKSTATINESPEADLITLEFETQNPTLPPRPSSIVEEAAEAGPELPPRRSSTRQSLMVELPGADEGEVLNLPPPPSDMPDDYDHDSDTGITLSSLRANPTPSQLQPNPSLLSTSSSASNLQAMTLPLTTTASPPSEATTPPPGPSPRKKPTSPLSTAEAQFVVEIIFAIISELYTLSSAWVFRRSLLNVAKSILLRPGNASLESIRVLIQETVIEANTEDKAVGSYIRKIRESAFMTDEELKAWKESAAKDAEEEEEEGESKREKARRLVRERGLPEALRGVMGGGASAECCSVMFDALQEEGIARGVVSGLVCEAIRGVCQ
ncbi:PXA domain-domain-containing protein [Tuber borchii]|uniref:PXA domain-domain-containing protein n=1 Tax=Tuber borchii TaxID=42251 RepID=A0A2T6ZJ22_TUBBO|nr:PXA domain-domain-containing protein [Tuber borchii]